LDELLRDPTLEQPTDEYYRVRLKPHGFMYVTRDSPARILSALESAAPPSFVRCETVGGSVAHVRTETVIYVHQSTKAQREAERRFWKQIDDEDEEEQPW